MYEPDKILCEQLIDYFYNGNFRLSENESVVIFKNVSRFRLCPHFAKTNLVALVDVATDKEVRGEGIGSSMLEAICEFLDHAKLKCLVHPESYGENKNQRKLRAWYKQHGFKPVTGQSTMIRQPQV